MPKNHRRGKAKGAGNGNIARLETRPVTIRGTCLLGISLSAGSTFKYGSVAVAPSTLNSDRLLGISDTFNAYRFTRMRMHIVPSSFVKNGTYSLTGLVLIGYNPVILNAAPSFNADIAEFQSALMYGVGSSTALGAPAEAATTVPAHLDFIRSGMDGFLTKWLKTRATSSDDLFEYQGQIVVGWESASSANVPVLNIMLEYECQFKDPVPTVVTSIHHPMAPPRASLPQEHKEEDRDYKEAASVIPSVARGKKPP